MTSAPGLPLDATHDPALRSWVESANDPDSDFPIQNLPFGRFRVPDDDTGLLAQWRIGVAIGDCVLDVRRAGLIDHSDMNRLIRLSAEPRRALRAALSAGLQVGSAQQRSWAAALYPLNQVELGLPCHIGNYTDFYVGIHHATNVGRLFRPDNPLLPNYRWVPIGYHGRSSSILPSGVDFRRPQGQTLPPGASQPLFGPSRRLDLELELGVVIGRPNPLGQPILLAQAEEHIFGLTLFNDWSARDLQAWEYQPLGPFLSKNFASTLSPWMVTLDALAPYRRAQTRPADDPAPLPYLHSAADQAGGALDIALEVWLQTPAMRQAGLAGECISRSNYADAAYWSMAQMVTHHTVGGCNLEAGDLLGTGTLSGPRPEQAGSLLELTRGGQQPLQLANGETRTFLEDGDRISLRGYCERPGLRRIGFGPCSATVLPSP